MESTGREGSEGVVGQPELSSHREQRAQAGRWTGSVLLLPGFDGGTKGDETGWVGRVPGLQGGVNCVKKFTFCLAGNGDPG